MFTLSNIIPVIVVILIGLMFVKKITGLIKLFIGFGILALIVVWVIPTFIL